MSLALKIVLAVVSVILTISILLQSSNSAGLSGSIGGGAEQLFGKEKPGIRRFAQQNLNSYSHFIYRAVTGTCCAGIRNPAAMHTQTLI